MSLSTYICVAAGLIIHQDSGEKRRLGEYQIKLLDVLLQHAGKILSREELTHLVWERRVIGNNSLPNAIYALRCALEDDGKKQMIIQTIPRKGYILDASYCTPISPTVEVCNYPVIDPPARSTPPRHIKRRITQWPGYIWLLLLVLFIIAGLAGMMLKSAHQPLQMEQQISNRYQQIQLYRLQNPSWSAMSSDTFYPQLSTSLQQLDHSLAARQMQMKMYYFISSSANLNLTLLFKSECQQQQLIMTIQHWRANVTALNQLITRETERKINEMANCSD
ncbi:MAG: winged helix-turn-helix domain-containing protein [Enterobacteriaceae bacterium]